MGTGKPQTKENHVKFVYELTRASTPREVYDIYLTEDQKVATNPNVDYFDPNLLTNRVKEALSKIDFNTLSTEEKIEFNLILWLWNHHAISYAIWHFKNKRKAQEYAEAALHYQPEDHPNHLTQLLYYLVYDKLSEAEQFLKSIPTTEERATARKLVEFYKEGGFFS